MVLDEILPEYDAARIEHRVIDGAPEYVCDAVLRADFGRVPACPGLRPPRVRSNRCDFTLRPYGEAALDPRLETTP
jgi:hypothetical protein